MMYENRVKTQNKGFWTGMSTENQRSHKKRQTA